MKFTARAWLERLSMSLVIIALVLAWEGYKRYTAPIATVDPWRPRLYFASAVACGIVGFVGVALRHRPRD